MGQLRRLLYGPPNWLITKFSAEDRRMFGFWVLVVSAILAIPFGRSVLYVAWVSVVALIPNFTSETPVEHEDDRPED